MPQIFRSGLGSPTDISVVREATAALQSVFPQTELGTFMSLTKRDKVLDPYYSGYLSHILHMLAMSLPFQREKMKCLRF